MCNTRETIKRSWLYGLYAEKQHMLNAHTPASTRVTTHFSFIILRNTLKTKKVVDYLLLILISSKNISFLEIAL